MKYSILLTLLACGSTEKDVSSTSDDGTVDIDNDNDGFTLAEDCDDNDASISPSAEEICDGLDNNCDGNVDEDVTSTFYADSDNDGYGSEDLTIEACEAPDGFVNNGSDCNDTDADSYPSADELCDGLDNDCDEEIDEDLDMDFFIDADDDGFGDDNNIVSGCSPDLGLSTIGGDCDDTDATISPLANEICDEIDNNCDGSIDEGVTTTYYADTDSDTYGDPNNAMEACEPAFGYVDNDADCNDVDSDINPSSLEYCDTVDNDCDGDIDEEGAADGAVWYEDGDEDGFGDANSTLVSCDQPTGYVSDATDCDDNSYLFYPGAPENCNGFDDNCNGEIDEDGAINATVWYADHDGDGYGDNNETLASCNQPTGYLSDNNDCDDEDNDTHPGATEYCDGEDNDCDDVIDESDAADSQTWYTDADGDGFGDANTSEQSCNAPSNGVLNADDCNDATSDISPDADEQCDTVDNDCDGSVDESDAIDQSAWYEDGDGDGYGDVSTLTIACDAPFGHVDNGSDCDDVNSTINPDAEEICDALDNNCDGVTDGENATDASTWYVDYDGDTYGSDTITMIACDQPNNFVENADDCDDTNASVYLAQTEICDGIDNDCNGIIDDDTVLTYTTWYEDYDDDTYGDPYVSVSACAQPTGYVEDSSDCNDVDASVSPAATEVCDDVDNDCNGTIDDDTVLTYTTWYEDYDDDTYGDPYVSVSACAQPTGYVTDYTDCNDVDASVSPAATEVCDDVDNDCNGTIDDDTVLTYTTWYEDYDGDTYGDPNVSIYACAQPTGYVADSTDCDDVDSAVNPDVGCGTSCQDLYDLGYTTDGAYIIDPDGYNNGEDPIEVYCDMTTNGGGWTLCASLTKGYVPGHMLHDEDMYAFQARLNDDNNYVYETDAPARYTTTWDASETLNYGQFCRHMGSGMSETWITAKMWNWANNYGSSLKATSYNGTYSGVYSGNLFLQWFTNSSASRTFTRLSGDQLYIQLNDGTSYMNNSPINSPYVVPLVSWGGSSQGTAPYTHTFNPWISVSTASCVGCTESGSGYSALPYGQTSILNDLSHSFWSGIPNLVYGWSDCTNNGNCNYHESGYGVWLFYVR